MSEVFYRKWRPRRLDEVVGQEAVTQTLRQAVLLGRTAHAYLFCGPRGTGKTSTARILAMAANCLSPVDGEPDNECAMCQSIREGHALDLIEIDAASNRGIDDIRNLSDKVHFTPNEARYKVYIIDEVHMLTEPAFNALLKTLEEPPGHAIFILATTEAHKVPLTVVSRCQRFDFRRIPLGLIVDKLRALCQGEGIDATEEALTLIARSASGSLRDAENLLEQAAVSYGSTITEEQLRDLLGLDSDEMALDLAGHIINKAVPEGLAAINSVVGQGSDLRQLHRGLMEYLRGVLLLKTGAQTALGYPDDTTARLEGFAEGASMHQLVDVLKTFGKVDMRRDSSSPLPLELALVESSAGPPAAAGMAKPRVAPGKDRSGTRAAADVTSVPPIITAPVESSAGPPAAALGGDRRDTGAVADAPTIPPAAEAPPKPVTQPPSPDAQPSPERAEPSEVPPGPAGALESQWGEVLRSLRHTGRRFKLGALLRGCKEQEVADGIITLKFQHVSHVERMKEELSNPETHKEVNEVLARILEGTYDIKVSSIDGGTINSGEGAAQRSHLVRAAQSMGAQVVGETEEEP